MNLLNEKNDFDGVIALDFDFSSMKKSFNDFSSTSLYFIVDENGIIIISNLML